MTAIAASTLMLSMAACTTPGERAAGGAVIGGVTGAAVGGAATGRTSGALAGAAVGAAGGAIVGASTARAAHVPMALTGMLPAICFAVDGLKPRRRTYCPLMRSAIA
jgi:osmotically inducible lipoprotein OsmB